MADESSRSSQPDIAAKRMSIYDRKPTIGVNWKAVLKPPSPVAAPPKPKLPPSPPRLRKTDFSNFYSAKLRDSRHVQDMTKVANMSILEPNKPKIKKSKKANAIDE